MLRFREFAEELEPLDLDEMLDEETTGQIIQRIKANTVSKKKYAYAADLVKKIYDRKKKEGGMKGPKHGSGYYAAQIAKQIPGVDARILAGMVNEAYGDMDWGTSSLVKKYMKDTPNQKIIKAEDGSYTYKGTK
jgi:hypothetical protein